MLYLLFMSSDQDILSVKLNPKWGKPDGIYYWNDIKSQTLELKEGSTIIVVAHGNNEEIGNGEPGSIDIDAPYFLLLINENMEDNEAPGEIFISTCGEGIAQFSADVCLTAKRNQIWDDTRIFGHSDPAIGPVPPRNDSAWTEIFQGKNREENVFGVSSFNAHDSNKKPKIPVKWPTRSIAPPLSAEEKYNQPTVKHYVFNETGNIMLSSTEPITSNIDSSAKDLFEEVAVFFAAMTKAITSTTKPGATPPYKPTDYYTIYDYVPLENIVNRSGMFVNVHREDMTYTMEKDTVSINIKFVEAVLGVALTDGIGAGALLATLNAMGKQATFSYNRTKKTDKIGNILFVCEYLLGLPIVSVLYLYLDESETMKVVKFSPCFTATSKNTDLAIHKDTFLFVVPSWIKKYAGDLSSIDQDVEYKLLVNQLESYISTMPIILSVEKVTHNTLTKGQTYTIKGVNFGKTKGKLFLNGIEQDVVSSGNVHNHTYSWTDSTISFTATLPANGNTTTGPIVVETAGKSPLVGTSVQDYTIKTSSQH
ncbi:hypothetical protein [[Muricauda] lutisoli]|uniref:IPT/TIG domain-containing protein n=1 Tax=[Muricauda] lutisoli TaxID=2816035 RepID=A0ABS3EYY2_9FLAO|nr:hypothetical protein [[Muricauda] lutisoli]MBO0331458.1 hypothetical protein [[Muricauda] lutisoli]